MRVIVERLVRRLDYETVAEHIPEADRKLLTHIRKEQQRKQRKGGQSEEGSQVPTPPHPLLAREARIQAFLADNQCDDLRSRWGPSRSYSSDIPPLIV